jgi:hypothetical protein
MTMTYDIYDAETEELLAEDWPKSAALRAEYDGYRNTRAAQVFVVEHGLKPTAEQFQPWKRD